MNNKRIVSLCPAATEMIYALEIEKLLAGRSHECLFPFKAKGVRPLSRSRWGVENEGKNADEIVSELFNAAFSSYDVHVDAIKKIRPDVIITTSMKEECGLSEEDLLELTRSELGYDVELIDVQVNSIDDMFSVLELLAEVMDVEGRAKRFSKLLRNRIKHMTVLTDQISKQKSVLFLEWLNPMVIAGNYIPDLIETMGGVHLLTSLGDKSREISFEEVSNIDPEVILIGARGLVIDEIMDEIGKISNFAQWSELSAVKNRQVYAVDALDYFSKPSPRLIDSMEVLCDIFYPENFLFGHKGKNFIPIKF